MKRFTCILLGAVLAVSSAAFTGCNDKKDSEHEHAMVSDDLGDDVSVAEEDLPYGATMVQLTPELNDKVKMNVEYDRRFLCEDEAVLLANYFTALNDKDAELFKSLYYMNNADYLSKKQGAEDSLDLITKLDEQLEKDVIGSEFKFNYVLTDECVSPADENLDSSYNFDNADFYLSSYAESEGVEDIKSKITSRKGIKLDVMYDTDSGNYSLTNKLGSDTIIYIYQIDGQYYIV